MKLIKDLGRLYPTENSEQKTRFGLYECSQCKNHVKARTADVKRRSEMVCKSCASSNRNSTHNESKTRLYNIWNNMVGRCHRENDTCYDKYGARGIHVCEEWKDFEVFKSWALGNGYTSALTIDRKNNELGYNPSNCRWATKTVQARNTRNQGKNASGYRCVYKARDKWTVKLRVNYESITVGTYTTKEEAALAYNKYVIDNKLEHTLNVIKETDNE